MFSFYWARVQEVMIEYNRPFFEEEKSILDKERDLYKEVRESEEKYQHLTDSADIGIISFDREGKIFQFNKKSEDIFAISREEIIDSLVMKILPEKHKELYEKMSENYITSRKNETLGQPIIAEGRSKDDLPISLEISYSVWGDKLNPIITATIRDL